MPELPEVETIRRGLADRLSGRMVDGIEIFREKQFSGDQSQLLGQTIISVERLGKLIVMPLTNGWAVAIHLKMTGQLLWKAAKGGEQVMGGHPEATYISELPNKYTRLIFQFDDGSKLFFNDLRSFGYVHVLSPEEQSQHKFMQSLGPEPLSLGFTDQYLQERLKKRPSTTIKAFLLDQTNIAGIGNIYADESLFRAAILPTRKAGSLTAGEGRNLVDCIQETLEIALMHGGSTEKDYLNSVGEKGTYLQVAQVYRKTGQDCPRCHEGVITRSKVAGRSTHYCPECQR